MRKNSKVTKDFGKDAGTKIKARFANEAQAQRVGVLFQYVHLFVSGGGKVENVREVLASDIDKCLEVLDKIQTKHPEAKALGEPPECPHGLDTCKVDHSPEHDQWRCKEHGLLYADSAGNIVSTL